MFKSRKLANQSPWGPIRLFHFFSYIVACADLIQHVTDSLYPHIIQQWLNVIFWGEFSGVTTVYLDYAMCAKMATCCLHWKLMW